MMSRARPAKAMLVNWSRALRSGLPTFSSEAGRPARQLIHLDEDRRSPDPSVVICVAAPKLDGRDVSETIQGKSAESKKEGNKEIAKGNTNASIGDRISAGVDAIGNKADESKHDSKAEAYKTSAQH
ncbi:Glucose-repressible protein [Rhodotorula mucilaginosa]|uniref:Glucose-repressible protein n=1 Tax=Rhodotorula mucilaginosa TaxID=5537 RepID=A0A9P7B3Y0_RHOMI|nr:Glucose-repressible protein [Rhodotorula mucilaginosa]